MTEVLRRELIIELYVDSKNLFDLIAKDIETQEKRFQIDIFAMGESH